MNKIDNLSGAAFIGNADRTPAWHNPQEIRVRDLKAPLLSPNDQLRHSRRNRHVYCNNNVRGS
jgi:hypothetical protein